MIPCRHLACPVAASVGTECDVWVTREEVYHRLCLWRLAWHFLGPKAIKKKKANTHKSIIFSMLSQRRLSHSLLECIYSLGYFYTWKTVKEKEDELSRVVYLCVTSFAFIATSTLSQCQILAGRRCSHVCLSIMMAWLSTTPSVMIGKRVGKGREGSPPIDDIFPSDCSYSLWLSVCAVFPLLDAEVSASLYFVHLY